MDLMLQKYKIALNPQIKISHFQDFFLKTADFSGDTPPIFSSWEPSKTEELNDRNVCHSTPLVKDSSHKTNTFHL